MTSQPSDDMQKLAGQLLVELDLKHYKDNADSLEPYRLQQRVANYLAGAQIFLHDNAMLERPLKQEDIKERLLGHWGTCPGINLAYAHCNRLINKHQLDMMLVTGPGHGAPANLANLWLEGSLGRFYPQYGRTAEGFKNLVTKFSTPSGFPSHTNPELPGQIHEGGELGYALSVAFGAVMDNPDLIAACIVGDGEAETGATAAAWHSYKYIDPKESGAVLPILHVNGFKISETTIFGCMTDAELAALFTGYGYAVRVVKDLEHINEDMAASMDWAHGEIRRIQQAARHDKPIAHSRWPMIVLRTPKGWTGPKRFHDQQIEGSFHSHQVPLPTARKDQEAFQVLKEWLESYHVRDLVKTKENGELEFNETLMKAFPDLLLAMGCNQHTYSTYKPLPAPKWQDFAAEATGEKSCMKEVGNYLAEYIKMNPTRFRIFSPDEMYSNKLDAVFKYTSRNFQWDDETRAKGGRVIEVLSEHICQGFLQGYVLTGRVGLFPSYETFLGIITTMMVQYAKFLKISKDTVWRMPIGSLNYVETSTLWRQEHNGFSHQNPMFINSVLNMKASIVRVYLPPDSNCFLSTMDHCLQAKSYINLMIGSKHPTPVWLTPEEAHEHCVAGASVWKFCSTDDGVDPDVVFVGCGTEITFEVIAAASMLRKDLPKLRVRVVNVTDLMVLPRWEEHPHALSDTEFDSLFTKDKPVVFDFHGYPSAVKQLLYDRGCSNRVTVLGYKEEGTTTTPFRMLTCNEASRYDVAIRGLRAACGLAHVAPDAHRLIAKYQGRIREHEEYILKYGKDPEELMERPQF